MKISLNYLKTYLSFDLPPIEELENVIGARLGALEGQAINLADMYKDVLIVKLEKCEPIEGSDHLNLCLINDGRVRQNVDRDQDGLVSVVCGAANVRTGVLAAWLPPEAIVPSTFFNEQFKLSSRPLRGQVSNGMLASPRELDISDDHEGILIIEEDLKPGDSFAEAYQLDDTLIDIENKMFTHRPDCFGLLGVAREISGILNQPFKSPDWYMSLGELKTEAETVDLKVQNELPSKCPRFSIIAIDNIEIQPSPILIQSYLHRMGIRPVNNIVDLTNLVMLETGQPLHAYDYHKLKSLSGDSITLNVRSPRTDESLTLLNGKTVKPSGDSIGIALGDKLIGLAGVMGGASTEVDNNTKAIVLESACFNMYDIRRTSMELGVFSEAVTRFTKGQSPLQCVRVLGYACSRVKELLPGAKLISKIVDDNHIPAATLSRDSIYPTINLQPEYINSRLGTELPLNDIARLLTNVECQVESSAGNLTIKAPFWRTDMEIREDIVEEVGRLHGFENIVPRPLNRPTLATVKNKSLEGKALIRQLLASAGANELLTYSFISRKLLENSLQQAELAYQLANSISPELEFYRLSLTPSLLSKVTMNIKAGFSEFALFEIGTYHLVGSYSDEQQVNVPAEFPSLALVYASKHPKKSAAYFKARNYLSFLLNELNIKDVSFMELAKVTDLAEPLEQLSKPFDTQRSAVFSIGSKQIGIIGEFNPKVLTSLKLPSYSAGFEVDIRPLLEDKRAEVYKSLSKYPALKQDITLSVPLEYSFGELNDFLQNELSGLAPDSSSHSLLLTSIFKPKDADLKNYSYHFVIADELRTLKDQEINDLLNKLAAAAELKFKAKRI